jgi:murein L,D-transpeptidase YcbB/YkuD
MVLTRCRFAINRLRSAGQTVRAAVAAAAVCVLAASGAFAETPGDGGLLVPASLQPADAVAAPGTDAAPYSEIRNRLESGTGLAIAGEKLHGALLRQFYAAHNYAAVWPSHPAQAKALLGAVLRAGEQGLDPDLFHAALLHNPAAVAPIDRELLLSDAVLGYADALARGVLPIEERMDDEDLRPEPVDVAAALDAAINSADPAAAITALAPHSADYRALQRALAAYRAQVVADDAAPAPAIGGDPRQRGPSEMSSRERLRAVEVNLERLRWLPRNLPPERVWVNLASARLVLYRADQPVFVTRVVIGQPDKQTPELRTEITSLLYNPPWNVPRSIATTEILPKLSQDPNYLARHHMVFRRNGAIEQLPGHGTALGQLKFEMEDRFDVYLHDTPEKSLFARDNRRKSHGCVRVQNPRDLAALLLQQPVDVINRGIAAGTTNRRMLPAPVPVFLVYQTAVAEPDGSIAFFPDIYDRDDEIWQRLHPVTPAPVAEHQSGAERRG